MARISDSLPPVRLPKRMPLYQQIRENLIERVSAGEWEPGAQIPSESELSAQFGVSVGTIRKAVETLVADSILVKRGGTGTFVNSYRNTGYFNHFQIVRQDGVHIRDYDERRLVKVETVPVTGSIAASLKVPEGTLVTYLLRHFYRNTGPIRTLTAVDEIYLHPGLFKGMTRQRFEDRFLPTDSLYQFYDREFGVVITSQKCAVTWNELKSPDFDRLQMPEWKNSVTIRRLSKTWGRSPVEVRIHHFEPQRIRIEFDIE